MKRLEMRPPHVDRLFAIIRLHPEYSNAELSVVTGMSRNAIHQWKRVGSKAGLLRSEVASANSTTDAVRA